MTKSPRLRGFRFRQFMVEHQYKVMLVSILVGLLWVGSYHLFVTSWFLSHLSILMAVISFVPAGLVALIHLREFGPFMWWDRSNRVLVARRSHKVEKIEMVVMGVLWTTIFGFVVLVIFVLSR